MRERLTRSVNTNSRSFISILLVVFGLLLTCNVTFLNSTWGSLEAQAQEPQGISSSSWSMYLHDPGHTGFDSLNRDFSPLLRKNGHIQIFQETLVLRRQ